MMWISFLIYIFVFTYNTSTSEAEISEESWKGLWFPHNPHDPPPLSTAVAPNELFTSSCDDDEVKQKYVVDIK